tara:strand:+ start:1736 stop:1960 length:225 start_codon:yes stop_codon:yes gene_type:complete
MNATPHTVIGYSVIKLIGGNLPDLIDKKMYLTILLTNFKVTNYLHKQKVVFNPKPKITRYLGYALVLITIINLI